LTQASLKIIICTTFLHGSPQVCPPALHITLGIFYRLFTLFERECHQLDLTAALHTSSAPGPSLESFRSYSKALQEVHRITDYLANISTGSTSNAVPTPAARYQERENKTAGIYNIYICTVT
jgi:hypothetical protein